MASVRTQIYLTADQRRRLDERRRTERKSLAEVIRDAIDAYLRPTPEEIDAILERTYGADPDINVPPRSEWNRELG